MEALTTTKGRTLSSFGGNRERWVTRDARTGLHLTKSGAWSRKAADLEIEAMDELVFDHAVLTLMVNAPRKHRVEWVGDSIDQMVATIRKAVRACPRFSKINADERARSRQSCSR